MTQEEIEKELAGNNNEKKILALISAVESIEDVNWLYDIFIKYSNVEDFWISKTAINCLGDIARIYRNIDFDKIIKHLKSLRGRKELITVIDEAIEDIQLFYNKK